MAITQLNPPLWLNTPKGYALAHFLVDYGKESDLYWVCFQQDTGEIWTWPNPKVRACKNISLERIIDDKTIQDKLKDT